MQTAITTRQKTTPTVRAAITARVQVTEQGCQHLLMLPSTRRLGDG